MTLPFSPTPSKVSYNEQRNYQQLRVFFKRMQKLNAKLYGIFGNLQTKHTWSNSEGSDLPGPTNIAVLAHYLQICN